MVGDGHDVGGSGLPVPVIRKVCRASCLLADVKEVNAQGVGFLAGSTAQGTW